METKTFTVETERRAVRNNKHVAVSSTLVSVSLLQHGCRVAEFDSVPLADRCADLLNKYGVRE